MIDLHKYFMNLSFKSFLEAGKDYSLPFKVGNVEGGVFQSAPTLFGQQTDVEPEEFLKAKQGGMCISGFQRHATVVNSFAQKSPENMAQTVMFSALTANRNFTTVFGYFPILVTILKQLGKKGPIDPQEMQQIAWGLPDQFKEVRMLINSDSAEYAARIWNRRQEIYSKLTALNANKDYVSMLDFLKGMKSGMSDVKPAFDIQMVFGSLACMDAHNIRIYAKMAKDMNMPADVVQKISNAMYLKGKTASQDYVNAVQAIAEKFGMGSQHFWDLWCDYVVRRPDSVGRYGNMGPALNPLEDVYQTILKALPNENLPIIVGSKYGMAGSLAHLAATTKGVDDFTGKPDSKEDWRQAVPKFAGANSPALALAKDLTSPEGLEKLKQAGSARLQKKSQGGTMFNLT